MPPPSNVADEQFVTRKGGVKRPRWPWLALSAALFGAGGALVIAALATGAYPLLFGLIHTTILGSLAGSYAFRSVKGAKFAEGTLTAAGRTVALDGRVLATAEDIRQGFVVPGEGMTLVRLDRHGLRPPLWLRVRDADQGRALLRSLGLDATQTAAELTIASRLVAMSLPKQLLLTLGAVFGVFVPSMLLSFTLLRDRALPAIVAVMILMFTWIFGLAFAPTSVRVGTDGMVVRWLWRERFVSLSDLDRLEIYDELIATKRQHGVSLWLRGGERVRLPTGQTDVAATAAAQLCRRIEEAREAFRAGATPHPTASLARHGRAPIAWVRSLRGVGAGANADMRTAHVPIDELLRVVQDASAAAIERASAAVAAVASAGTDARARVRVAAETAASPKLRVALQRIAEPETDEESLAEALVALEEPPGEREGRR